MSLFSNKTEELLSSPVRDLAFHHNPINNINGTGACTAGLNPRHEYDIGTATRLTGVAYNTKTSGLTPAEYRLHSLWEYLQYLWQKPLMNLMLI